MLMGLGVGVRVLDPGPAASEGGTGIGRGRGGSQRGRGGEGEVPGGERGALGADLGSRTVAVTPCPGGAVGRPTKARPGPDPGQSPQDSEWRTEGAVTHQMALQGERG